MLSVLEIYELLELAVKKLPLHYYAADIRPVLEYSVPVWDYAFKKISD